MHPVIRIVTFFVLVLGATTGSTLQLAATGLLLVMGYSVVRWHSFRNNLAMLKRMRWLFLSILIIYLWFTPGQLLLPVLGVWSPSLEGLNLGLYRISSLVMIVLAVTLLVRSVDRADLISAILWLLTPFSIIGLPRERLAIRIALVFDVMGDVQKIYDQKNDSLTQNQISTDIADLDASGRSGAISVAAIRLFQSVLDNAIATRSHEIEVAMNGAPPPYQWSYPVFLLIFYYVL